MHRHRKGHQRPRRKAIRSVQISHSTSILHQFANHDETIEITPSRQKALHKSTKSTRFKHRITPSHSISSKSLLPSHHSPISTPTASIHTMVSSTHPNNAASLVKSHLRFKTHLPFTTSTASFALIRAKSMQDPAQPSQNSHNMANEDQDGATIDSPPPPFSSPTKPLQTSPLISSQKSPEQELFESLIHNPLNSFTDIDLLFKNSLSLSQGEKLELCRLSYNDVNLNPARVAKHFGLSLDALTITSRDRLHDQLMELHEAQHGRDRTVGGRRLFNKSPIHQIPSQDDSTVQISTLSSHSELIPIEALPQVGQHFAYDSSIMRPGYNLHPLPPPDPSQIDKTKLTFTSKSDTDINFHNNKRKRQQHSHDVSLFQEAKLGAIDSKTTTTPRDRFAHTTVITQSVSAESKSIHSENFDFSTKQFRTFEDGEIDEIDAQIPQDLSQIGRAADSLIDKRFVVKKHSGYNPWSGSTIDSQERFQGSLLSALTMLRTANNISHQLLQHLGVTLRDLHRFHALPRHSEFFIPNYTPSENAVVTGLDAMQDANEINLLTDYTPKKQQQILRVLELLSSHLSPKIGQLLFQDQYIARRLDALTTFVLEHPNLANLTKLTKAYNLAITNYNLTPPPRLHSAVLLANHFLVLKKSNISKDNTIDKHRALTTNIQSHITPPNYLTTHPDHKTCHTLIETQIKKKDGTESTKLVPENLSYGTKQNPFRAPGSLNIHNIPELGKDYALPSHLFTIEALCHDAIGNEKLQAYYTSFNKKSGPFGHIPREKLTSNHLALLPPSLSHYVHLLTSPIVFGNFSTQVYNSHTNSFVNPKVDCEITPGMFLGLYHIAPEGFSTQTRDKLQAPTISHAHQHVLSIDLHRCLTDIEYAITQLAFLFGDVLETTTGSIKHTVSSIKDVSIIPIHTPSSLGQLANTHLFLHQLDTTNNNAQMDTINYTSAMTPSFDRFGAPLFSQRDEIARHSTMLFSIKYRWLQGIWEAMRYEHILSTHNTKLKESDFNIVAKVSDNQQQPLHQKAKHFLDVGDEDFRAAREKKKINIFKGFERHNNPEQYAAENPEFNHSKEWGNTALAQESDDDDDDTLVLDEDEVLKAASKHKKKLLKEAKQKKKQKEEEKEEEEEEEDGLRGVDSDDAESDSDDFDPEAKYLSAKNIGKRTKSGRQVALNYDKLFSANVTNEDIVIQEAEELLGQYRVIKTNEINDDPLLLKFRQSLNDPSILLPTPSIYTLEFTRALIDAGIYHEMYLLGNDVTPEAAELISNNFAKLGWNDASLSLLSSSTQPVYTIFNSSTETNVLKYNIQPAKRVKLHPTISALRILSEDQMAKTGSTEIDEKTIAKQRVRISDPFLADFPARAETMSALGIDPAFIQSSTIDADMQRKLDALPSQLLFSGIEEGDGTYRGINISLMTQSFIHNIRTLVNSLGTLDEKALAEMMVSTITPRKFQLYQESPELYNIDELEQDALTNPLCATHLNQILSFILQQPHVINELNLHIKPTVKFPTQYQAESYLSATNTAYERYGLKVPSMAPYESIVLQRLDALVLNIIHKGGDPEQARELARLRVSVREVIVKRLKQKLEIFNNALKEHQGKVKAIGMVSEIIMEDWGRQYSKQFRVGQPASMMHRNRESDIDQVLDFLFRQSQLGEHLVDQSVTKQPAYDDLLQNTQMKKHLSSYAVTQQTQFQSDGQQNSKQNMAQRIKLLQTLTNQSQLDPTIVMAALEQEQPLFSRLQPTFLAPTTPLSPAIESLVPIHSQTSYFTPINITKDTPPETIHQLSVLHKGHTEYPSLSAGVLTVEYHINTGDYKSALDGVIRSLMRYDLHRKMKIEHLKRIDQYDNLTKPSREFPYPQLLSYGFLLAQALGDWSTATWLLQYVKHFHYTPSLSRITRLAISVDHALSIPNMPPKLDPNSHESKVYFVMVDTLHSLRASIGKKLWLTVKSTVVHTQSMTIDVRFVLSVLSLCHNLDDIMQLYFEALAWPVNVNTKFFAHFQSQIQLVISHQRRFVSPEQIKGYYTLQNYLQFIMQRVFSQQFRLYQALQTENLDLLSILRQIRVDDRLILAQRAGDITSALNAIQDIRAQNNPVTSSHWGYVLGTIAMKWKRNGMKSEQQLQLDEGESIDIVGPVNTQTDQRFRFTLTNEQQQDVILAHKIFSTCILEDKLEDHHLWIHMLEIASLCHDSSQVLAITQFLFSLNGIPYNTMLPYHTNEQYHPFQWTQDKFSIYNVTWESVDDLEFFASQRLKNKKIDNERRKGSPWTFSEQLSKRLLQSYKYRVKPINIKNMWNALDLHLNIQDVLGPFDLKVADSQTSTAPVPPTLSQRMSNHIHGKNITLSNTPPKPSSINSLLGYCLPWTTFDRLRLQSGLDNLQYYHTLYYGRLQQQQVRTTIPTSQLTPLPTTIPKIQRTRQGTTIQNETVPALDYSPLLSEHNQASNSPIFNISYRKPLDSTLPDAFINEYYHGTLSNFCQPVANLAPDIPITPPRYALTSMSQPPMPTEFSAHTAVPGHINQHPLFSLFSPIHLSAVTSSAPVPSPEMLNIALPHLAVISPIHSVMALLWTINHLPTLLSPKSPRNLKIIDSETGRPPNNAVQTVKRLHHEFASKHGTTSTKVQSQQHKVDHRGRKQNYSDSEIYSDSEHDELSESDIFNDDHSETISAEQVVVMTSNKVLSDPDGQYVSSGLPQHIAAELSPQEQTRLILLSRTNNDIILNGYSTEDISGLVLSTARSLYSSGYYGFAIAVFNLAPKHVSDSNHVTRIAGTKHYTDGFRENAPPTHSTIHLNNSPDQCRCLNLNVQEMDPIHSALYVRSHLQPLIQDVLLQMIDHYNHAKTQTQTQTQPQTQTQTQPIDQNHPDHAHSSVDSIISALRQQTASTSYNPYNCPAVVISTGDYINPDRVLQESIVYHFNSEFNLKSIQHHPVVIDMLYSDHTTSTSYNPNLFSPTAPGSSLKFDQLYQYLFASNNTGQLVITPYTITNIAYNIFTQLVTDPDRPPSLAPIQPPTPTDSPSPDAGRPETNQPHRDHLRRLGEMDMVNILEAQFYQNLPNLHTPGPNTQPNQHSWWKNVKTNDTTQQIAKLPSLFVLENFPSLSISPQTSQTTHTRSHVKYHWAPPITQDWMEQALRIEQAHHIEQQPQQHSHQSGKSTYKPTKTGQQVFEDAPPPPGRFTNKRK